MSGFRCRARLELELAIVPFPSLPSSSSPADARAIPPSVPFAPNAGATRKDKMLGTVEKAVGGPVDD